MAKKNNKDKVKNPYFHVNVDEGDEELIDLETLSHNKDKNKNKNMSKQI